MVLWSVLSTRGLEDSQGFVVVDGDDVVVVVVVVVLLLSLTVREG